MRVKLAFAAITVVALGVVACEPSGSVTCHDVPAYSVTFEDGSSVGIPDGTTQVNGGTPCHKVTEQWEFDRQFEGYRAH